MEYRPLSNTGIDVSVLCLGTMTFGEQNSEQEAFALMDMALAAGVNFFDTAEIYSVPPREETQGRSEEIVGRWLRQRGYRDQIILATKVAGPGRDWLSYIRGGNNRLDRRNLEAAVDASLRRLQTDVIDLYQLHWPERQTNYFGQLGYTHMPSDKDEVPLLETLDALADLVNAGKIRQIGVSNETPWGLMRYHALAETHDLPKTVSIQNPYSLLNRTYEIGLAEIGQREQVGLLAYSPMAFGVLSGKYLDGAKPPNARLTLYPNYDRYSNPEAQQATRDYVNLAQDYGLEPAQLALAFVNSRPFLASNIIGVTTEAQLNANLRSVDLVLDKELLEHSETIHRRHPNPSP